MKTLKNLTAEQGEDAPQPKQILHGLHEEYKPGNFRCYRLTRSSLICSVGQEIGVVIPLAELAKLVTTHEPRFNAAQPKAK